MISSEGIKTIVMGNARNFEEGTFFFTRTQGDHLNKGDCLAKVLNVDELDNPAAVEIITAILVSCRKTWSSSAISSSDPSATQVGSPTDVVSAREVSGSESEGRSVLALSLPQSSSVSGTDRGALDGRDRGRLVPTISEDAFARGSKVCGWILRSFCENALGVGSASSAGRRADVAGAADAGGGALPDVRGGGLCIGRFRCVGWGSGHRTKWQQQQQWNSQQH